MKRNSKRIISLFLMLVLVVAMAVPVCAAPKMSKKSATMVKGQTMTISLKGASGKVKWSTSKKSVAAIKASGKKCTITAKKAGSATITAKVGKKKYTCKVKVEAPKLSKTKLTLKEGKSTTLKVSKTTQKVKWSSSDKSVATVSSKGKVTAKKKGIATITAKINGVAFNCTVTVTGKNGDNPTPVPTKAPTKAPTVAPTPVPDPFTASDYSVSYGSVNRYIEFEIREGVDKTELEKEGYTIEGSTASKTTTCETATYTFKRLPKSLEGVKKIKLDTKFAPMAANIVALNAWENIPVAQGMYTHPMFDIFEYLMGADKNTKLKISNADRSGMYTTMQANLPINKTAFFEGATPKNGYKVTGDYKFTLTHGPYYIPEHYSVGAQMTVPETHMILIKFDGDDSERYCDVYNSSNGNWYCWQGQWKHLCASVKPIDVSTWATPYDDYAEEGTLKITDVDYETIESDDATDDVVIEAAPVDEVVEDAIVEEIIEE